MTVPVSNIKVDLVFLTENFPKGQLLILKKGEIVCHLHKKVEYIHWLISGSISFYLALHEGDPEVEVCQISESFLPIGWNGLNPPGRHTKNIVVASDEALFYQVRLDDNQTFLATIPSNTLQIHVCKKQFALLKQAVFKQKDVLPDRVIAETQLYDIHYEMALQNRDGLFELMKKSPFLEPFDDAELQRLAAYATRRDYGIGETIIAQDELADGLYILMEGHIAIQRFETDHVLSQWPITEQGFIFGWPSLIDEPDFCTARAASASAVYFIASEYIHTLLSGNNDFALRFYIRMNWLVDNHISAAFIRFLGFVFNANQLIIRYLIENYLTQIRTSSKLHEIPHLLNHRTTKYLAFDILENLRISGSARERRIASISLDLLEAEKREMEFGDQLQCIYETVAEESQTATAQETRKACAAAVKKLNSFMDYSIAGWDNLPDTTGHIFIYNHLLNHPYYTLNNNFQITLDSHFISAMILDERYGEPGIRTVRMGNPKEFAHQNYYERLGYVNVFTRDSGDTTPEQRAAARDTFFDTALAHLNQGYNLIISPEGTSYRTEDDIPGEFKPGAFRLALKAKHEPVIVPIILLNFDKRIHEATKYCKILKPFRITEHPLYNGADRLSEFVSGYRLAFKKELDHAKCEIGIQIDHQ